MTAVTWVAIETICLGWFLLVTLVTTIGTFQIFRHYRRPPFHPVSANLELQSVPHVTIIRPCKGLEPFLYECLASTFHTPYARLTVYFCVSSRSDAAFPVLCRLLADCPDRDARVYIEEDDPVVQSSGFGPNPKIRNMSRAYREAKGDIVWILDCNIWVSNGALGRLVDKLCGFGLHQTMGTQAQTQKPYKLVAHLPVCVDVDGLSNDGTTVRARSISASASDDLSTVPLIPSSDTLTTRGLTGSMLEQSFLSTAHAKMYVAINSVSIAPCINGKSTAFRKSHLDHLTHGQGIDYFSHNICEDHLIGDLLWKSSIPATLGFDDGDEHRVEIKKSNPNGLKYRNHGLAVGDLAIQPIAKMSVKSYVARRVRWLRVRKFTVMLATLVEPGTESLLCCAMGAFGLVHVDKDTKWWVGFLARLVLFALFWCYWCVADWFVSGVILGMGSVEHEILSTTSEGMQPVVEPPFTRPVRRRFTKWLRAWISREVLALPVWTWAIWGGTTVTWRERTFRVGMDMRVHEILPSSASNVDGGGNLEGTARNPARSVNAMSMGSQNGNTNRTRKMS